MSLIHGFRNMSIILNSKSPKVSAFDKLSLYYFQLNIRLVKILGCELPVACYSYLEVSGQDFLHVLRLHTYVTSVSHVMHLRCPAALGLVT